MTKRILNMVFMLFLPLFAYTQSKISKSEILTNINEMDKIKIRHVGYELNFDSVVVKELNYLSKIGIDTIGVYNEKYVGSEIIDSCECGIIPWVTYIQWIKDGITFQKKVTECCNFETSTINYSTIIRYYVNCQDKIDKESMIPMVVGIDYKKYGSPSLIFVTIDHTIHYSLYCKLGKKSSFITFEQFDIGDEDNLFYLENNNTAINSWRKLIQNQTNAY